MKSLKAQDIGSNSNSPPFWFVYQNDAMYGYYGDLLECSAHVLERARSGQFDPEVENVLERVVNIGLPERYLKAPQ